MSGRLVHTGQVLVDLVMRVPALPPPGGDVMASDTAMLPGGGFNVVAAAARAGAPVLYAGGHGTGPRGELVRAALAAEGVQVAAPPDAGGDTGICVTLVEPSGERTFVTGSGVESGLAGGLPPTGPDDVLYVSGYSLLVPDKAAQVVEAAADTAGTVLLDPGPLVGDVPAGTWARMLAATGVLSCNAREAKLLSGEPDATAAGRELARRLPDGAVVVVRDGAAGCVLVRDGRAEQVPAPSVRAVDTNGAGDAHCGVLAAELLRGAGWAVAARRANAAAALAVTRHGPATAPTRAEVDALLTA
ncbi:sugar kinase [Pseudonocardia sp. EC080610-09]|uniref:PfkB family carbohydrate kinase n=1 Tax=unclassified Pseudonocardia TaxID=2619320 RepID=UPI0006CB78CE|nr:MULTISPECIES: PfkB family carbohydrate kinase [unclassified Pseudonocardia]ALE74745.1 sugar kinase [Pseudonocardia sp. EC080625-04]ALL78180.1 sugar kinase [Pseudonocardia sp. EC080610-09]ALL81092.1 sugar kinase [Pseudonocardia sp. EC080619-01]